jgi:hypothetical protein
MYKQTRKDVLKGERAEHCKEIVVSLSRQLFQKDIRIINKHIKNIHDEGALDQGATIQKFRIVQKAGGPSNILAVRNLRTTALDFQ